MRWTHLRDETPKARKSHRCFLCREPIGRGETYVRRSGISDGEMLTMAMHPECEAVTRRWDESDWECFSEGDMPRPGSRAAGEAAERERIGGERELAEAIERQSRQCHAMED
jgi:hypothetical protein